MTEAKLPAINPERPAEIECLPPWLTAALTNLDEKRWDRPRIAAEAAPTEDQRRAIQERLSSLDRANTAGPWERSAKAIGVLMATYPVSGGDDVARARVVAFRIALDDMPAWAVEQAVRAWLRGEVKGRDNTAFLPAPPQLRALADEKRAELRAQRHRLQRLLAAEVVASPQITAEEASQRAAAAERIIAKAAASRAVSG